MVAERVLHQSLECSKAVTSLNCLPLGASVSPERYDDIRLFITNALMLLRRDGILVSPLATRYVIAGPRAMTDIKVMPIADGGEMHELQGSGFFARAVDTGKGWVLLRGSTVRREVMPSANSSVSLRRAEWLNAGFPVRAMVV